VLLVISTLWSPSYVDAIEPLSSTTILGVAAAASAVWKLLPKCYYQPGFPETFAQDMEAHIYGQHLATQAVPVQIRTHIEPINAKSTNRASSRALALSLHGKAGTGKTYMSGFVQRSLFAEGAFYGHIFYSTLYDNPAKIAEYKRNISDTIQLNLRRCDHSLFVFVDAHNFPKGTLDVLAEFLDTGATNVNGLDYTKAIFILQSNDCEREINEAYRAHLAEGKLREEVQLEAMQRVMTSCIKKGNNSVLYEKHLVYYVPFLPIERAQLLQCIDARLHDLREEYLGIQWSDLRWDPDVLHFIADKIDFVMEYARGGCKDVASTVDVNIIAKITSHNRYNRKCGLGNWFTCYTLSEHIITVGIDRATNPSNPSVVVQWSKPKSRKDNKDSEVAQR